MRKFFNNYIILILILLLGCSSKDKKNDNLIESKVIGGSKSNIKRKGRKNSVLEYGKLIKALRVGNKAGVINESAKLLEDKSNDMKTLNALATFYLQNNQSGIAKNILGRNIKENGGAAEIYNNLGVILSAEKDFTGAKAFFKKGLSLESSNVSILSNLSAIYMDYGLYKKAWPLLKKAFSIESSEKIAGNYMVVLLALRKYASAMKVYKKSLKKTANPVIIYNYAILLLDGFGKRSEAIRSLKRSKALNKSSVLAEKIKIFESKI